MSQSEEKHQHHECSKSSVDNNEIDMSSISHPPSALSSYASLPPSPSITSSYLQKSGRIETQPLINEPLYVPLPSPHRPINKKIQAISWCSSDTPLVRRKRVKKQLVSVHSATAKASIPIAGSSHLNSKLSMLAMKEVTVTTKTPIDSQLQHEVISVGSTDTPQIYQQHSITSSSTSQFVLPQQQLSEQAVSRRLRPRTATTTITRPRSTARRPSTATGHRDHRIMVLAEGRGVASEVGVCIIHVTTGECVLSQIPDSQSYTHTLHKIHLNDPHKILFSNTALESDGSQLTQLIKHHFPDISIIAIPRKYFNDDSGMKAIKNFGLMEDTAALLLGLSTKYYCLAAAAAAFRYIADHEGTTFVDHTVKFSYQGVEGTMLIDIVTAKNLEIVSNSVDRSSKDTLFGVLDHTVTPMGGRLLRTNLLQPSTNEEVIEGRLDAVQELVGRENFMFNIQSVLKSVTDLDNIIANIVKIPATPQVDAHYAEIKINHVIRLKTMLMALKSIASSLQSCSNILLVTVSKVLLDPRLNDFQMAIDETLHDDVGVQKTSLGLRHQRCYAVKSGVNGLLDVARQTYKETIEDIYEMASEYNETTGLNIKLQFNTPKGFYLSLPADQLDENTALDQIFINIVKKKKQYTFTTLELLQKNSRMNESLTEVYLMSDKMVTRLLQVFREDISVLYKVSEAIAMLDMLLSFSHCCSVSEYVRPEFTNTLAIENGRHPIMESIQHEPVVPNNTFASLASSFQLITGPNMSGKTCYIKQIALLTIMAQAGSFVPATYASFRLCDQVLSRFGNDAFTEVNTSSFMAEMREAAYIIQNVTNNSLVIVDELGKGTAPYDALGLAASISEHLIKSKAFCFFTTHLHQLTKVLSVYPNVVNLQLKVDILENTNNNTCTLSYSYMVNNGSVTTNQHYGLKTAQLMGFPTDIIAYAFQLAQKLNKAQYSNESDNKNIHSTSPSMHNKQTTTTAGHGRPSEKSSLASISNYRKFLLQFADKMIQHEGIPDDLWSSQLQEIKSALHQHFYNNNSESILHPAKVELHNHISVLNNGDNSNDN